jgi:potassium/hydrogen antiporter
MKGTNQNFNYSIEYVLFGASVLLVSQHYCRKNASIIRVTALIIFILVGMVAGSEEPRGIEFDNPWSAQILGVIALAFIILSGGLHSSWKSVSPVLWTGVSLSTIGVSLTAILVHLCSFADG